MLGKIDLNLKNTNELYTITKALASEIRIEMLKLLSSGSYNVNELAEKLNIPASTAALNVKVLEDAGLIITELQPGVRGSMKLCSIKYEELNINLTGEIKAPVANTFYINMPIGNFVDAQIQPTCGIVNENGLIGIGDNPKIFYHQDRTTAQLIWFSRGFLEYRFSNSILEHGQPTLLEVSLEICSEAPQYRNNWPSDITMWINGKEIGTWTSPGDFGGRRGRLNPSWWSDTSTQYGLLKTWRITAEGSFINEERVSGITLDDLDLLRDHYISVKIGIKDDAVHIGGISLFGEKFGDHAQNIVMRFDYLTEL
jgi:predicted transcriptional regulator